MPCTNRVHPDWWFFAVFGNEHKGDLLRLAIDPGEYAKTAELTDEEVDEAGSFSALVIAANVSRTKIEERRCDDTPATS